MNREILFKAKRKDWKELPREQWWVEGYYAKLGYGDNAKYFIIQNVSLQEDISYFEDIEIDSDTLCQYTGLTDKNGRKIWENDIVVCKQYIDGNLVDYCVEIGYVEMKCGAFGLHRKQGYYRPFKDWFEDYEYEVIGNIFDNADLLEV